MAIVENPLVFFWACNGSYGSIYEPKAVVQWSTLSCYSVNIYLEVCRAEKIMILIQYLVSVYIVNKVKHLVGDQREHRHWFSKSGYHVTISTWVRHSP